MGLTPSIAQNDEDDGKVVSKRSAAEVRSLAYNKPSHVGWGRAHWEGNSRAPAGNRSAALRAYWLVEGDIDYRNETSIGILATSMASAGISGEPE